ncbi:MAG: lipopolysaccharide heptosyltransferase II [Nitrospirota bacterium]
MSDKRCDNILVRGVNWIGDAVMTMPALRALKLANPGSKITLLVKPWVSPLFEKDPFVDKIILYEKKYESIPGKFKLANVLRKHNFCMAVLFQNAFDAAILSFLAGIPERIGYNRDGRGFLLTKRIEFDGYAKRLHHIEYYLNFVSKGGIEAQYSAPWIYMSVDERLDARKKLEYLRRPVIAINPGATYGSSKRWQPERYAEIARKVVEEMKGSVVIFGGLAEKVIAEEIYKRVGIQNASPHHPEGLGGGYDLLQISRHSLLNLSGRTGLRELSALISECDVLVTNDSGPMHIGYAVGTPVVAIFGSTSPEHTGPTGKGNIVVMKKMDCAPCLERECKNRDLKCMDAIGSDEVYGAVKQLVASKKAVFFDRDGTLCRDPGYLGKWEDFEVYPEVSRLKRLKEKGFVLIGITNQSGIARGLVDEDFVKQANSIFIQKYGFDYFYYCPHHPDAHCPCRKPEPGLLLNARAEHKINLKKSFIVGDKESDMLLANAAGAKGIFIKTGKENFSSHADFTAGNLEEAVEIILMNSAVKDG